MSEWIECGLPFYAKNEIDFPPFPDLSEEESREFGQTEKERKKKDLDFHVRCKIEEEVANPLLERLKAKPDYSVDKFYAALRKTAKSKKISKAQSKRIKRYVDENEHFDIYLKWENNQPKVIAWKEAMDKVSNEHKDPPSFDGQGFANPGVLIEVEEDGEIEQYLIGDINTNRGVCDDCVAFDRGAIVKRYKVIWTKETK